MRHPLFTVSAVAVFFTLTSCGRTTLPLWPGSSPGEVARSSGYKTFSFLGPPGGEYPYAGLVYVKGVYYGTTQQGGKYNSGTVF